VESAEEEWLSIKDAANLRGCVTQNIRYHFGTGNLKDYKADAIAAGRNSSLRIKKSELLELPQSQKSRDRASDDATARRTGLDDRLQRIEELLEILLGARGDAAQIFKARVDQQEEDIQAEREQTYNAQRERDAVLARLQSAKDEADKVQKDLSEQRETLKTYADALTQLLIPPLPPDP
jgi:hypothetical protein